MARRTARQRGYTSEWEKAARAFLAAHPWCRMCQEEGQLTRATLVDHVRPHRGDPRLFWQSGNWQPLCTTHHSSAKQQVEKRGYHDGVGRDGLPLDPAHPFNRGEVKSPARRGSGPPGEPRPELVSAQISAVSVRSAG